jgi:TfoX/Sxy family transcriptional regulator of competence genes
MAYNEAIDGRVGKIVSAWKDTSRKRMFGGTCYLLRGNMFSGVYKNFLMLRLGEKGAGEALRSRFARPLDITGRPMKGWVMISHEGFKNDEELEELLNEAREFVDTLPPKRG